MWSAIPAGHDNEAEPFVAADRLRRRLNDTLGVTREVRLETIYANPLHMGWKQGEKREKRKGKKGTLPFIWGPLYPASGPRNTLTGDIGR